MGSWDELCLLCGVSGGGPSDLLSEYGLEDYARQIASELAARKELYGLDLFSIVKAALAATLGPPKLGRRSWLPDGLGSDEEVSADPTCYTTWRHIAVGYFDKGGEGKAPMRGTLVPDGKHVQIRQVVDCYAADYSQVVCRAVTPSGKEIEVQREVESRCSVAHGINPNVSLCERCYHYLKAWLDTENLPRPAVDDHLSFAGELYEIVNSRKETRDRNSALLPCLDYAGIAASLEQWQSHFMPCRRGTKHISQAIEASLRGADLIPALLRDCRAWMFMRPDTWPTPSSSSLNGSWPFSVPKSQSPTNFESHSRLCALPNELLLSIFGELSLLEILSLSATCRSLRILITDPTVLNSVLRDAVLHGSLRWVLPVRGLLKEEERAFDALRMWLPGEFQATGGCAAMQGDMCEIERGDEAEDEDLVDGTDEDQLGPDFRPTFSGPWYYVRPILPPLSLPSIEDLLSSQFPYLPFIRACWESDSMMNRKRLWGMVKQFEGLWREHRLYGWQVNRFYPSEEILSELFEDEEGFRPVCEAQ